MEPIRILAVVGPTAVGKSAYAVELAKRLGGEILSCDSMQVYRGMDIGTAKPTEKERGGIPHHLLDVAEPDEPFSCADYVEKATLAVREISARGKIPIFCGGTGLYLDRFLFGGVAAPSVENAGIREELSAFAKENGNQALYERLKKVDPVSALSIHPNNVRRVARALEIYLATGTPKSVWDEKTKEKSSPYAAEVIGLTMLTAILIYNLAVRFLPFVLRQFMKFVRFIPRHFRDVFHYLKGECYKQ